VIDVGQQSERQFVFLTEFLTPSTTALCLASFAIASRNPQASFVQPGVSSLG
jgi:hypothetical protein